MMLATKQTMVISICLMVVVPPGAPRLALADPQATGRDLVKLADAEFQKAQALYAQEKYTDAITRFQTAAEMYDTANQPFAAARMIGCQGDCYHDAGRNKQAVTAYRASVERFANLGKDGLEYLAMNAGLLGEVLNQLEQFDEAAVALDRATKASATFYGADHFHTTDARLAAADARLWAQLTREQRKQLDKAEKLNIKLANFCRARQYSVAMKPAIEVRRIYETILGDKHPYYASSLSNLALVYSETGEGERAMALMQQAAEIYRAVLGENHPRYARSLRLLAITYDDMGKYARAESLYMQSLAIRKTVLGETHVDYINGLNSLASLYTETGEYARAERLFKQATEIRRGISKKRGPGYARILHNFAHLYREMGDFSRAIPLMQESTEVLKSALGKRHSDYINSLNSLATLYANVGDDARAEKLFEQVLERRKNNPGKTRPVYVNAQHNLALIYTRSHDYARAEPLMRKAMETRKTMLGEMHPQYADSLNSLAMLYTKTGDYARAEPLMRKALEIRKAVYGEMHPKYASSLSSLAGLYQDTGECTRAEMLYLQALKIRKAVQGEDHPDFTTSLINLGALYADMNDYSRAVRLTRQATDSTAAFLERSATGLTEQQQLALGQMLRYRLDSYLSLLARMDRKEQAAFCAILAWKGSTLVRQRAMRVLADQPDIESLFQQLQSVTRRWARLAMATPPVEETRATRFHEQLVALQTEKEKLEADLSRQSAVFRDTKAQITLKTLLASLPKEVALVDFFQYNHRRSIELPRKGDIGAQLKQTDKGITVSELISEISPVDRARLKVGDRIVAVADPQGKWIRTQDRELAEIVALLTGKAGTQVRLRIQRDGQIEPLETKLTRVALPYQKKGEWKITPSLTAFVVRPGRPVRQFNLGPVAPIRQAIDTWRQSFGLAPPAQQAGRLLREKLWQPLLPSLADAQTVLVSPDGVLGRLPLVALPGKKPGTYLLEDHRLAIVPVPQLIPALMAAGNRKKLDKELLLLGGADYDALLDDPTSGDQSPRERRKPDERGLEDQRALRAVRGDVTWKPLKETTTEVAFIRDLYTRLYRPDQQAIVDLRGRQATEDAFRCSAPQCTLLHVATHGFFATADRRSALSPAMVAQAERSFRDSPFGERRQQIRGYSPGLLSGLVFAGANNPPPLPADPAQWSRDLPDDGIMSSDEIAFLPLEGVRLVVLSACETGLGEVAGGEGLLGLQRSFQISGARSTVATLWKVKDAATRRIMEEFYTNYLDKEMSMLDALRAAQLWALHHPHDVPRGLDIPNEEKQETRTRPYYWAAFVLSGDWR